MSSVVQEIRTSLSGLREYVEMVNSSFERMENKIKEMENTPTNIASQASPNGETKGGKHPKDIRVQYCRIYSICTNGVDS